MCAKFHACRQICRILPLRAWTITDIVDTRINIGSPYKNTNYRVISDLSSLPISPGDSRFLYNLPGSLIGKTNLPMYANKCRNFPILYKGDVFCGNSKTREKHDGLLSVNHADTGTMLRDWRSTVTASWSHRLHYMLFMCMYI